MIGLCAVLFAIYSYLSGKQWLAIFLLFALLTAGFQLVPVEWILLSPAGISKPYDWMWVFTGAVLLLKPQVFANAAVWGRFKLMALFCAFLVVLLAYSIVEKEIEFSVTIRVFRNFLFFLSLFLFVGLKWPEYEKIFRSVVYVTSFACVLYCLQSVLHTGLLNRITSDMSADQADVTRYYNVPVFLCPVIFFLFYPANVFNIKYRIPQLCVCSVAMLLTQHRNLMMAVFLCYLLYMIMNKKLRLGNAVIYGVLGAGLLVAVDTVMDNRLSKGFEDVSKATSARAVKYMDIALSDLSTTEFRKHLFNERLHYVMKTDATFFFGIGLMTDDSKKAKALQFYIGIPDDDGNISQIANIDIAWASLILQLGIVGTCIFILVHLHLLKVFYSFRGNPYMQVGILFLVSLFISSFYGSMISMPYTMCMTMLFGAGYYQLTRIYETNSINRYFFVQGGSVPGELSATS